MCVFYSNQQARLDNTKTIQYMLRVLLAIVIPSVFAYTPYPDEETNRIRASQSKQWDSMGTEFYATQTLTFVVERRVFFFINSSAGPQTFKMRGRAYFVDDRRKFVGMETLSPFDVTKVYVYAQNRLILKSEEFYERFAFSLSIKDSQMIQILFQDGPPGPLKMIHWEIDYEIQPIKEGIASLSPGDMQLMSGRLKQVEQFLEKSVRSMGLSQMEQNAANAKMTDDWGIYSSYIGLETVLVAMVMIYETVLLQKMLKTNDNIIMI